MTPRRHGPKLNFADAVVLDVGAYTGTYTVQALRAGARHVTAVEPHPRTAARFRRRIEALPSAMRERIELLQAACVNAEDYSDSRTAVLYCKSNAAHQNSLHKLRVHRRVTTVTVPIVQWREVHARKAFDIVKLDCEGSEYELLLGSVPKPVSILEIEFHILQHRDTVRMEKRINRLEQSGWLSAAPRRILSKTVHVTYARDEIAHSRFIMTGS